MKGAGGKGAGLLEIRELSMGRQQQVFKAKEMVSDSQPELNDC